MVSSDALHVVQPKQQGPVWLGFAPAIGRKGDASSPVQTRRTPPLEAVMLACLPSQPKVKASARTVCPSTKKKLYNSSVTRLSPHCNSCAPPAAHRQMESCPLLWRSASSPFFSKNTRNKIMVRAKRRAKKKKPLIHHPIAPPFRFPPPLRLRGRLLDYRHLFVAVAGARNKTKKCQDGRQRKTYANEKHRLPPHLDYVPHEHPKRQKAQVPALLRQSIIFPNAVQEHETPTLGAFFDFMHKIQPRLYPVPSPPTKRPIRHEAAKNHETRTRHEKHEKREKRKKKKMRALKLLLVISKQRRQAVSARASQLRACRNPRESCALAAGSEKRAGSALWKKTHPPPPPLWKDTSSCRLPTALGRRRCRSHPPVHAHSPPKACIPPPRPSSSCISLPHSLRSGRDGRCSPPASPPPPSHCCKEENNV